MPEGTELPTDPGLARAPPGCRAPKARGPPAAPTVLIRAASTTWQIEAVSARVADAALTIGKAVEVDRCTVVVLHRPVDVRTTVERRQNRDSRLVRLVDQALDDLCVRCCAGSLRWRLLHLRGLRGRRSLRCCCARPGCLARLHGRRNGPLNPVG